MNVPGYDSTCDQFRREILFQLPDILDPLSGLLLFESHKEIDVGLISLPTALQSHFFRIRYNDLLLSFPERNDLQRIVSLQFLKALGCLKDFLLAEEFMELFHFILSFGVCFRDLRTPAKGPESFSA